MSVKFKKQNVKRIVHPKMNIISNLYAVIFKIFYKVEYLKRYAMIVFFNIKNKTNVTTYRSGRT